MYNIHSSSRSDIGSRLVEVDGKVYNVDALNKKASTAFKNPPTYAQLKLDIRGALPSYNENVKKVLNWVELYESKTPEVKDKTSLDYKIDSKDIKAYLNKRIPSLIKPFCQTDNLFKCSGSTSEADSELVDIGEKIINFHYTKSTNRKLLIDTLVNKLVIEGVSIIKSTLETSSSSIFDNYNNKSLPIDKICDIQEIIVDPSCKNDITKAKFAVHQYVTSYSALSSFPDLKNMDILKKIILDEIKSDKAKYEENNNTIDINVPQVYGIDKGTMSYFQSQDIYSGYFDLARKPIFVQEYYGFCDVDESGKLTPVKVIMCGDLILYMGKNPFPNGILPFTFISYNANPSSLYGEPDTEVLSPVVNEIRAIKTGIMRILSRNAVAQRFVMRSAMSAGQYENFISGKDVLLNDINLPIDKIVHTLNFPDINPSALNMLSILEHKADSLVGYSSNNNGFEGQSLGKTAVGVKSILSTSAIREEDILQRIASGLCRSARIAYLICLTTYDSKDLSYMSGYSAELFTEEYKDALIKSRFILNVDISTVDKNNDIIEKLSFLLQTMSSDTPEEIRVNILSQIFKALGQEEDSKKILEVREPSQFELAQQQLALEKLKLENARIQAQTEEDKADVERKIADAELKKATAKSLPNVEEQAILQDAKTSPENNKSFPNPKAVSEVQASNTSGDSLGDGSYFDANSLNNSVFSEE